MTDQVTPIPRPEPRPPKARKALPRKAAKPKRTATPVAAWKYRPSKRPGRARPWEPLAERCQARTPKCRGRASERHHRKLRSQGGPDDAWNTVDVCGACHRWIHDHPAESYESGLLLRRDVVVALPYGVTA